MFSPQLIVNWKPGNDVYSYCYEVRLRFCCFHAATPVKPRNTQRDHNTAEKNTRRQMWRNNEIIERWWRSFCAGLHVELWN